MRLSSALLIALAASAGCRTVPYGGAVQPGVDVEGAIESPTEGAGAPEGAPDEPREDAEDQGAANPGEVPSDSGATSRSEERRAILAGITLSAMGAASAGMGGFLLGWSVGACDPGDTSCAAGIALPIVGALSIAGGAIPLVMGVSLWAPTTPSTKIGKTWPEVTVGPAAASARWRF